MPDAEQLDVSGLDTSAAIEGAALAVLLALADGDAELPG